MTRPDLSVVVVHHRGQEHLLEALDALGGVVRRLARDVLVDNTAGRRWTRCSAGTRTCGAWSPGANVGLRGAAAASAWRRRGRPSLALRQRRRRRPARCPAAISSTALSDAAAGRRRGGRLPDGLERHGRTTSPTGSSPSTATPSRPTSGGPSRRFRAAAAGRGAALRLRRSDGRPARGVSRLGRFRRRLLRLPRGRGLRLAAVDLRAARSSPSRARSRGTAAARRAKRSASSRADSSSRRTPSRPPTRTSTRDYFRDLMPAVLVAFVTRIAEMLDSQQPRRPRNSRRDPYETAGRAAVLRAAALRHRGNGAGGADRRRRSPDGRPPAGAPLDSPQPRGARRQAPGRAGRTAARPDAEIFGRSSR